MSIKSIGYAIGMIGLLFQGLDQIESEHDRILTESAQRHAEALKKIDSDTYGVYRMLEVGFSSPVGAVGEVERQKELTRIFKAYERRYTDKAKEGMREWSQLALEENSFWTAAKAVLKVGYSLTLVGALIIGVCEYSDAKGRKRND